MAHGSRMEGGLAGARGRRGEGGVRVGEKGALWTNEGFVDDWGGSWINPSVSRVLGVFLPMARSRFKTYFLKVVGCAHGLSHGFRWLSHGFRMAWQGFPRGVPLVFAWLLRVFAHFSPAFHKVFTRFSHGFRMVFVWFSHGAWF